MANENVNKVIYGNNTLIDLTGDSVSPQTLLAGQTAHDRSGSQIVGVATQGHTIIDASGSPVNAESGLQFATMQVTDDSTNGKTVVRHIVQLTQAEYDALPASKLTDNIIYAISDGTSRQIQANNVGYNGSNVASALDLKADKTAISNPNLLDNPWFTVNQRGQSSYTGNGKYAVDRWIMVSTQIVTLNSDGTISISPTSATCQFTQRTGLSEEIVGKEVTISIEFADGTIISKTGTASKSDTLVALLPDGQSQLILYYHPTRLDFEFIIQTKSGIDLNNIKAVKLELGSVSTLAQDTAPNYATELLKCQRYFVRVKSDGNNYSVLTVGGFISAANEIRGFIPIATRMRTRPSITKGGNLRIASGNATLSTNVGTVLVASMLGTFVLLVISTTDTLTPNTIANLAANNDTSAYIDLIADL